MPGKLLVQAGFRVELGALLRGAERVVPHLERDFPARDAVPGTPNHGAAAAGDRRTDRDEVVRNGGQLIVGHDDVDLSDSRSSTVIRRRRTNSRATSEYSGSERR